MMARKLWQLERGRVLRVLLAVTAWAALTAVVWGLIPHEPRISFALPEGTRIACLSPRHRAAVLVKNEAPPKVDPPIVMCGNGLLGKVASTASLWDLKSGELRADFSEDWRYIHPVNNFIANDSLLILEREDDVAVYEVSTGREIDRLPHGENAHCRFSPDCRYVVCAAERETEDRAMEKVSLTFWDTALRQVQSRFLLPLRDSHSPGCFQLDGFSPDSRWFAASAADGLHLLEPATGRDRVIARDGMFCFSPDSRTLAYSTINYGIALWDLEQEKLRGETKYLDFSQSPRLGFSRDSKVLITDFWAIKHWDAATGCELNEIQKGTEENPQWFPQPWNSKRLIGKRDSGEAVLWDATCRPARIVGTFSVEDALIVCPDDSLTSLVVSPDGALLAVLAGAPPDYTDLIDIETQQVRCRMPYYPNTSEKTTGKVACFSSDNRHFARALWIAAEPPLMERMINWIKGGAAAIIPTPASAIEVWDVNDKRRSIFLPNSLILGFSPDGKTLAIHDYQNNILQIWDLPLKKPLWKILAWSLGLGLYVFGIRWICGRILRSPERGAAVM